MLRTDFFYFTHGNSFECEMYVFYTGTECSLFCFCCHSFTSEKWCISKTQKNATSDSQVVTEAIYV